MKISVEYELTAEQWEQLERMRDKLSRQDGHVYGRQEVFARVMKMSHTGLQERLNQYEELIDMRSLLV